MGKEKKLTYEVVRGRFEREGYVLVSTSYKNSRTKLETRCPKGHIYFTTSRNFKDGKRCKTCWHKRLGDLGRKDFEDIKSSFSMEGYSLLTTRYRNVEQKLDFICPNGHRHSMSFHNWKSGWRCVKCRSIRQAVLYSGENHPQWLGGASLKGYCLIWSDKDYKASVRQRDNNVCQNPYCFKTDKVLAIHHIDYDKQNCHPSNLITVCRSCNSRANKDRKWHTEWYQTIIKNKTLREDI